MGSKPIQEGLLVVSERGIYGDSKTSMIRCSFDQVSGKLSERLKYEKAANPLYIWQSVFADNGTVPPVKWIPLRVDIMAVRFYANLRDAVDYTNILIWFKGEKIDCNKLITKDAGSCLIYPVGWRFEFPGNNDSVSEEVLKIVPITDLDDWLTLFHDAC